MSRPHRNSQHEKGKKIAPSASVGQPTNEDLGKKQATELEVIEAIFGKDYQKLDAQAFTASVWGKVGNHTGTHNGHLFRLVLRPDTGSLKSSVFVTATFRLPIRYPLLPPIITIPSDQYASKGLSAKQIAQLQDRLNELAKELAQTGEEMIWDLASAAQEYISAENLERKPVGAGAHRSLEEEKRLRDLERQQADQEQRQAELQVRAQSEEERASKIGELIRERAVRNSELLRQHKDQKLDDANLLSPSEVNLADFLDERSSRLIDDQKARSNSNSEFFMDPIEYDGKTTHQVLIGPVIHKRSISETRLVESASDADHTWWLEVFRIDSPHYNLSGGKRALEEIEWELDRLRRIRSPYLINILGSALVTETSPSSTSKKILVLHEQVDGADARSLLSYCGRLAWSRARYYLRDISKAIGTLHERNVLHRDVKLENVIITSSNAKLMRAGYAHKLESMNAEHRFYTSDALISLHTGIEDLPSGWIEPRGSKGKGYDRKSDIWYIGVIAVCMLFGVNIIQEFASAQAFFEGCSNLGEELKGDAIVMLRGLLDQSAQNRPSSMELQGALERLIKADEEVEFQASSSNLAQKSMSRLSLHKASTLTPGKTMTRTLSDQEDMMRQDFFWQRNRHQRMGGNASRYETDFEEIELLGKGAYGAVFKARNRLDGRHYAIKKIRLNDSAVDDEKTLREITALSRLSHQNIVRYVTCWIQTQDEEIAASSIAETLSSSTRTDSQDFRMPGLKDTDFIDVGSDSLSQRADFIRFADDESSSNSNENPQSKSDANSSSDESGVSEILHSSSRHPVQQSFSQSRPKDAGWRSGPRWLYIQMEYVENKTLREAIDKGLSIEDCWRLFRQIIEALAHVASLGIIHRDLKPSNILMFGVGSDAEESSIGDVKIGDFGLATTSPTQMDGTTTSGAVVTFEPNDSVPDQTTDIGTNLYIAPEVLQKGSSRYDHKVDVYAAGIVFFEMLASQRVYQTGMERIHIIRQLRLPQIRFPSAWNQSDLSAQTAILQRMLSHNPADRPTPLELLKSELLPPKLEDEYIAECLRLMSKPNSTYNLQLMDSLFHPKESYEEREARDFTFDTGSNERQGLDDRFLGVASQFLRTLFQRRGAVELEAPLLVPPNGLYTGEKQQPVEFLDTTGKVVQLPYDLTLPFARMAAHGDHRRFKRYAIAPVYRPNLLAGGQPRSVLEVDYDIVAPEKTPAAEAEVISVIDDILGEIPGLEPTEWVIQISHGALLDIILERVPSGRRDQALSTIAHYTNNVRSTATQFRARLSSLGLPRSITDEIDSANISDELDMVNERLQRLVAIDLQSRLARAIEEIRQVIETTKHFGVKSRFMLTPLLTGNRTFYRDNVFFVAVRSKGKKRDVLASGGRYDALLRRFTNPSSRHAPAHAVGVQISLGRIAMALGKSHEFTQNKAPTLNGENRAFGPFAPRRCDVYVASGPDMLAIRMQICRELWNANISADLAYEHALEESPELLASMCRAEGILFLVIARSRGSNLKIKNIAGRTEHEVHRWELVAWLTERLQKMRLSDSSSTMGNSSTLSERPMVSTSMVGSSANAGSSLVGGVTGAALPTLISQAGDVEVILPERQQEKRRGDKHGFHDTKRGRKQAHVAPIQESAARQVAGALHQLGSSVTAGTGLPTILAVDLAAAHVGAVPPSPSASNTLSSFTMPTPGFNAIGASVSPFSRLCAAGIARVDEALWKLFFDTLSPNEREYGRQIRQKITDLEGKRAWLVSIRSEGAVAMI